jgi:phospholipid-binding lipoprotein MlaA
MVGKEDNMFRYIIHFSITLALALYLTGCAASNAHIASEIPPMHTVSEFGDDESVSHTEDPWEGFNKGMYKFNYEADRFVFLPVVNAYETAAPGFVQTGVSNFFANIREVRTLYNSILQAKGKKSLVTLGRFLTNSTIGIGGLFDPAASFGWRQQQEDFDRTLETWGIGTGPYLVLPLLGPSTARNASGLAVDGAVRWAVVSSIDPFGVTGAGSEIEMGATALEAVDLRHRESFRYYESDYPFEYYMVRYIFSERRELTTIR